MTSRINTGGPAFPIAASTWDQKGMDMRDAFAIAALPAVLRAPGVNLNQDTPLREQTDLVAHSAYAIADAMIRARS